MTADILRCRWHIDWKWIRPLVPTTHLRTVMEVGIGPREISMLPHFHILECERLVGIDPNPEFTAWARMECDDAHEVAIGDKAGEAFLILNGGSSYLQGSWSPTAPPSDHGITKVKVAPFRDFDTGDIDILNVDCEGGEKAVFSQMISRPLLIGVELWKENPDRPWILDWLEREEYILRITTGPEGETMLWSKNQ